MNRLRLSSAGCALAVYLIYLSNAAQAATAVLDTFDTGVGTWIENTSLTAVGYSATGGNPGGYMTSNSSSGSFGTAGAQNNSADYTGLFPDGVWNISVDLNFFSGDFTEAWLRFRFQDASTNGWHISLEDTTFNPSWQTYSVFFDTTWSDATAIANGWVKDTSSVGAAPAFSTLWGDVFSSEVRILGGEIMSAGIDNYQTQVVPLPAAAWLFGSGLLGLGFIKRKRS